MPGIRPPTGTAAMTLQVLLERLILATRWLLAPIYLGIGLALAGLTIKFGQMLWHMFATLLSNPDNNLVLLSLTMIDMALVGSLMVMVMIIGYENTISQLNVSHGRSAPNWLGKLDPNLLKMKLAASIVAISSIHLLEVFMNAADIPNDKIFWYTIMYLTFVLSAAIIAVIDRLAKHEEAPGDHGGQAAEDQ
jgi:uncharacterized protein (TIGR00645 family)